MELRGKAVGSLFNYLCMASCMDVGPVEGTQAPTNGIPRKTAFAKYLAIHTCCHQQPSLDLFAASSWQGSQHHPYYIRWPSVCVCVIGKKPGKNYKNQPPS